MDKAKSIAKGGWHPTGKDGGKESWRGDNKGINQVAGWLGKGKDQTVVAKEHTSRPLASLKDPDAFGPPPKNVNFHGGAAVPNATAPDRRGLGTPLSAEDIRVKEAEERGPHDVTKKPAPPPVPYRANTTGINTQNLPRPPVRRPGQGEQGATPTSATKPKPSLPPRLPPRQNSHPGESAPEPPPAYTAATQQQQPSAQDGYLNQGALGRLGKAGVSVPGFGMSGGSPKPNSPQAQPANPWNDQSSTISSPTATQSPTLNGLSSRFGKLSTAVPPPSSTTPNQGTSMQQKQDALRTASMLRNDPSSVSLSDARASASTANNFRERHGEQVAAGGKWAGAMNSKYGIANKVNSYTGTPGQAAQASPVAEPPPASPWAAEPSQGGPITIRDKTLTPTTVSAFKKPPPPPPAARRPGVASPPPVPLGSKPGT
ncbi:hypothetical protein P7C71_g6528, partial [Lecanoromycetidae sp. Uapishka_2]